MTDQPTNYEREAARFPDFESDTDRVIEVEARYELILTESELHLLKDALDSHAYWQLSEPEFRDSGYVHPPGTHNDEDAAEIQRVDELDSKLTHVLQQGEDE